MEKTNRAGIGTFVMRGKEYLAAIRPSDGVLALETLHFADEVADASELLSDAPDVGSARGKQVDMAVSLIESMSGRWDPADYRDDYTDRVKQLVDDKRAGRETEPEPAPAEPTNVTDLVEVLRRSIEQVKSSKGGKGGKGGGRANQQPDLGELTKAELDAMARDLGIAGRSKMKRAELEKAVKQAGTSVARTAAS